MWMQSDMSHDGCQTRLSWQACWVMLEGGGEAMDAMWIALQNDPPRCACDRPDLIQRDVRMEAHDHARHSPCSIVLHCRVLLVIQQGRQGLHTTSFMTLFLAFEKFGWGNAWTVLLFDMETLCVVHLSMMVPEACHAQLHSVSIAVVQQGQQSLCVRSL